MPKIKLPIDATGEDAIYIGTVVKALESDIESVRPYLTQKCMECDETPDGCTVDYHGMIGSYIVIGCEGYFQVNPNVIGMTNPNWCDWR